MWPNEVHSAPSFWSSIRLLQDVSSSKRELYPILLPNMLVEAWIPLVEWYDIEELATYHPRPPKAVTVFAVSSSRRPMNLLCDGLSILACTRGNTVSPSP